MTTKSRPSPLRRTLIGALTATLGLAGVLVGGVSAASAHEPRASVTCQQLTVTLEDYNSNATNTVEVWVDDTVVQPETPFETSFARTYAFDDSTVAHTYRVSVHASDDPDGSRGYSVDESGSSTACPPAAPTVTASAQACTTPGGTTGTIDATITGAPGRGYTATVKDRTGQALTTIPVTDGTATFADLPLNADYTVTATDTRADVHSTSDVVHLGDCPPALPTINAQAQQCTTPGGTSGSITIATATTPGRDYVLTVTDAAGTTVATRTLAGSASGSTTIDGLPTGGSYTATVTDTGSQQTASTQPVALQPCPALPPHQATTASGTGSTLASTGAAPAPWLIVSALALFAGIGALTAHRLRRS
ncbi:hypothetical protein ACFJGV_12695 [Cnuibacter sp. UC19_7]|uniref:hypothetical protein n=1 Tax=Cnuibacter sp. UC19_7 TaxID=3350166 RepID=UPI0036734A18